MLIVVFYQIPLAVLVLFMILHYSTANDSIVLDPGTADSVPLQQPCYDMWLAQDLSDVTDEHRILDVAEFRATNMPEYNFLMAQAPRECVQLSGNFSNNHDQILHKVFDTDASTFFRFQGHSCFVHIFVNEYTLNAVTLIIRDNEYAQNIRHYELIVSQRPDCSPISTVADTSSVRGIIEASRSEVLFAVKFGEWNMSALPRTMKFYFDYETLYYNLSYSESIQYSMHGQDLEAMRLLNYRRNGVFLDIGAAEGVVHSNTYLMESAYNWTGYLVEPLAVNMPSLLRNRPRSQILNACVHNRTYSARFLEGLGEAGEFSGISDVREANEVLTFDHRYINIPCFEINTVLEAYNIKHVDFFSIDAERADIDILRAIDWNKFSADAVCVECFPDDTKLEVELRKLMAEVGYDAWTRVGWDIIYTKF